MFGSIVLRKAVLCQRHPDVETGPLGRHVVTREERVLLLVSLDLVNGERVGLLLEARENDGEF